MKKLTLWELIYAFDMALACAISYLVTTELLGGFIDRNDTLPEACGLLSRPSLFSVKAGRAASRPGYRG